MADPRDYILSAGEGLQQGIASWQAKQQQDEDLNRPLPEYAQSAFNPPAPVSPASAYTPDNSQQFDSAMGATRQGIAGLTAGPDDQSGYTPSAVGGRTKPSLLGATNDSQSQFEHPAIKHFADRVASGELDPLEAAAHAKRHIYTNRDLPGLQAGMQARQLANSARDRSGEIAARNEGALQVATVRADASRDVADMQTRQRRDSSVIGATASMYRTDALLKKAIEDNKSREKVAAARGQKVPDHVGQQLKGLQLQLEGAGKELASATQEYNSITTLAATKGDSGQLAEAHKRVEAAQAKVAGIEAATQTFLQSGSMGTSDGGQPFEVRMPAGSTDVPPEAQGKPIIWEYQFDAGGPSPSNPVRGGTTTPVQAPNMAAVPGGPPPSTNSGRPVQALPQSNAPTFGARPTGTPAPAPMPAPNPPPPPQQVGTVVITGAPGTKNAGRQKTISIADVAKWTGRGEYIVVAPQR